MLKIKINEDIIVAGTSEFRNSINKFISNLKNNKVILTSRNKPQAVLISYEEYERIGKVLEEFEDRYFGELALERLEKIKTGKSRVLTHEEVLKKYL